MSHHHIALNARRWQATRRAVLERDRYRCRNCGRTSAPDGVLPGRRRTAIGLPLATW